MQLDERRGVPSASGMIRVVNCPASHQMERAAAEAIPERQDKDAAAGSAVHAILSDDAEAEDVTYSAEATAEMCEQQVERLLADWLPDGSQAMRLDEQRYGLTAFNKVVQVTPESRASFVFTGKYDRLYIQGERGLLIDFKALNGEHAAAVENPQLASLAVLVSAIHNLKSVRVAIVQPRKGRPTVADYDELTLATARDWLDAALLRETQATPDDRHAGKWCHHCKARFGCDAFKMQAIQEVERIQPMSIAGLDGKAQVAAMWARAMEFSPEQHEGAFRGLGMVKRYVHAIESSFKARVEAGQVPGWKIETKSGNREITDAQAAFTALAALGVTQEDVLEACSIPVGAMEEAVRKRSGIKSQTAKRTTYNLTAEAAKKAVNDALTAAGALGRKADKSELVEVALLTSGEE
jgi:Protein of unknown function (DUF2800)